MSERADEFWSFSLGLYGRAGVSAACIDLQDRYGCDVNILLYACWTGVSGRGRLTPRDIARAEDVVAPWRRAVTEPVRSARRALKDADDEGARELYGAAKALELAAERVAQNRLAKLAPARAAVTDPAADAAANLTLYLGGSAAIDAAIPIFAVLGPAVDAGGPITG